MESGIEEIPSASTEELVAFWAEARERIGELSWYFGPHPLDSVVPVASAFGGTPRVADELAALIVAGCKTATASALWDYEAVGEPLPVVGGLEIVLDGRGRPRALIETRGVAVVPFDQVSAEHAAAEGEGDLSLAYWRSTHESFFTAYAAHERGFASDMPVVLQSFKVLFSR